MRSKTIIAGPRIVLGIVAPAHSGISHRTRGWPVEIGPPHTETPKNCLLYRSSERSRWLTDSCGSARAPRMPDEGNREGDHSWADVRSKDRGNDPEATPLSEHNIRVKPEGTRNERGSAKTGHETGFPLFTTEIRRGEVQSVAISLETGKHSEQDAALHIHASQGINVDPTDVPVEASESPGAQLLITAARDTALGTYPVSVKGTPERRCAMPSRLRL
jgi:hypothetical protein